MRDPLVHTLQGRQDSNLQPPVLETGALPIELLPSAAALYPGPFSRLALVAAPRRRPLGALFALLTLLFAGLTAYAAIDGQWIIAVAAGVLGAWMADLTFRAVR